MMYGNGWNGNSGCSFLGGGAFSGWYYLIIFGVVITVIALIFLSRRRNSQGIQAISTLKELFVKGEITEEEYLKRKNIIERQ